LVARKKVKIRNWEVGIGQTGHRALGKQGIGNNVLWELGMGHWANRALGKQGIGNNVLVGHCF
jgi:hypothetical protein